MQENNRAKTKKVLLDLANHVNAKGIRGLARFLEVDENRIYSWINRGVIPDTGIILRKCPDVRYEWLETRGEGEMLRVGESPSEYHVTREIRRIESDEERLLEMLREYPAFRREIMKLIGKKPSEQMKIVSEMLEKLEDLKEE